MCASRYVPTGIMELPFGRGKMWLSQNMAASAVLGGWAVSPVYTNIRMGFAHLRLA